MDDNSKHASSYQHDQEILDARGINMTVQDVAGLPTCKYTERVQSLNLKEDDLMFLKGLRRRIRNRLASQNSRRRSMENLRRLTRELRAVRACRDDALTERRVLLATRTALRIKYGCLRTHILRVLEERSDPAKVPDLEPEIIIESPKTNIYPCRKPQIFECRIDKLVQQSVNHIYKEKDKAPNKISDYGIKDNYIKESVFKHEKDKNDIDELDGPELKMNETDKQDKKQTYITDKQDHVFKLFDDDVCNNDTFERDDLFKPKMVCAKTVFIDGVLNLSKRKSHGRKQSAPRRIAYVFSEPDDEGVLDLKIKKESQ